LLEKRITEVETEIDGMMEGWKSVEGGKSLKGACERLLEERVSIISSSTTYLLMPFLSRTIHLRFWKISAVIWKFPAAGPSDTDA